MGDISDKIAELAEGGKGEKTDRLAAVIREKLTDFVWECQESLKTPLERGIAKIKDMDRRGF